MDELYKKNKAIMIFIGVIISIILSVAIGAYCVAGWPNVLEWLKIIGLMAGFGVLVSIGVAVLASDV